MGVHVWELALALVWALAWVQWAWELAWCWVGGVAWWVAMTLLVLTPVRYSYSHPAPPAGRCGVMTSGGVLGLVLRLAGSLDDLRTLSDDDYERLDDQAGRRLGLEQKVAGLFGRKRARSPTMITALSLSLSQLSTQEEDPQEVEQDVANGVENVRPGGPCLGERDMPRRSEAPPWRDACGAEASAGPRQQGAPPLPPHPSQHQHQNRHHH